MASIQSCIISYGIRYGITVSYTLGNINGNLIVRKVTLRYVRNYLQYLVSSLHATLPSDILSNRHYPSNEDRKYFDLAMLPNASSHLPKAALAIRCPLIVSVSVVVHLHRQNYGRQRLDAKQINSI